MIVLHGREGLEKWEGKDLGIGPWHEVTQEMVDAFADVTGDHQWIHVDVERARSSDFGGTIAHGYLTLSLIPFLAAEIYVLDGFGFALNYGLERLRFPSPLPVGSKIRMGVRLTAALAAADGGCKLEIRHTIWADGIEKPVCVADVLLFVQPERW